MNLPRTLGLSPAVVSAGGGSVNGAVAATINRNLADIAVIGEPTFLGYYDHVYPTNFFEEKGYGTQYVALAFLIRIPRGDLPLPNKEHREYRWFSIAAALSDPSVHAYTKAFLSSSPLYSNGEILSLYSTYQEAISYYTNIVWQFPTALMAMNIVAWASLPGILWMLPVSVLNFGLLHAFFKLVRNQRTVIDHLRIVETLLAARFPPYQGNPVIPMWTRQYGRILSEHSGDILKGVLIVANLVMFIFLLALAIFVISVRA